MALLLPMTQFTFFANAIEKAGTLDPDKVVQALQATDMAGAIGRIKFDQSHQTIFGTDPKQAAVGCTFQWQKGQNGCCVA